MSKRAQNKKTKTKIAATVCVKTGPKNVMFEKKGPNKKRKQSCRIFFCRTGHKYIYIFYNKTKLASKSWYQQRGYKPKSFRKSLCKKRDTKQKRKSCRKSLCQSEGGQKKLTPPRQQLPQEFVSREAISCTRQGTARNAPAERTGRTRC